MHKKCIFAYRSVPYYVENNISLKEVIFECVNFSIYTCIL